MTDTDDVTRVVLACVEEVNTQLPADAKLAVSVDCPVLGDGSSLDSLGLLNLLVAIEEQLGSQLGVSVDLLDEDLLAQPDGPLRTVGTIIEHAKADA